jgi:hypothetical protein
VGHAGESPEGFLIPQDPPEIHQATVDVVDHLRDAFVTRMPQGLVTWVTGQEDCAATKAGLNVMKVSGH